jgi:hypothetical protein
VFMDAMQSQIPLSEGIPGRITRRIAARSRRLG